MDKYEKLEALLDDAAVQQELESVDSVEAMHEVLKKHGVELTEEEIQQIVAMAQNQGELSDTDLDDVAGGMAIITSDGQKIYYNPFKKLKGLGKFIILALKNSFK